MKTGRAIVVLTLLALAVSVWPVLAIETKVTFSGVQPPDVAGATISLPGFESQPLNSGVCTPDSTDCAESDTAWHTELDASVLPGTIGIAMINTPAGDVPVTFSVNADGGMTITPATIDAEGVAVGLIDPTGLETAIGYDELGRVASLTYPSGQITGIVYEAEGVAATMTEPATGAVALHAYASGQITGIVYDVEDVTTEVTEPAPETIAMQAPLWAYVLLSNPSGAAIRIHYGSAGLVTVAHSMPSSVVSGWSPLEPMTVGPKSKVGTESLGSKAAKGVVGNLIGSLLGGGGGSSRSRGPKTYTDKTKKNGGEVVHLEDANSGTTMSVRGKWVKDGLLISNHIAVSKDKGTFQTIYLEDESGRRLWPKQIYLYKIWTKHTLTVSWTKSRYVDGALVSQQSGGWIDTWSTDLGEFERLDNGESSAMPSIWQQVGYDRAHAGARRVGTLFNVTPEDMAGMGDVRLVVHVTQPKLDPVTTTPFAFGIGRGTANAPEILAGM